MSHVTDGAALSSLLAGRTADELDDFFVRTTAVEVTDLIRATTDAELRPLMADELVRTAAVHGILNRLEEFADPERLAALCGVACFDLDVDGRARETHVLQFSPTGVAPLDDGGRCQVTIRAAVLDFVRMVTGQTNAALLYLSGRLRVEGDEMLALGVGTVFRLPGSGAVAVDPTALDPGDVATAVAASTKDHMREVMAGGFREIVLGEVFRRFPEFLRPDKAARIRTSVGFSIGGRADGGTDRFLVRVDRGACDVERDPGPEAERDATLVLDGVDFLRLITGQLNPVTGVLKGTLKVRGDKAKALALNAVMERPRPTPG
ncbi:hypothetical protein GCM10011519_03140 [Marmoricola endophyticus]|uniref:SCP2 domain-containing protein n=1 Tax=Marmoricola endophyticus TaxID=2040280 RepID=A0A917B9J1_9ACTN|nr:SCP2 sterol-binding domain-containing protein [Marmoricola endophyticus]GGF33033.1 hypothetical protein GCM10011519_03140 [Marmoricola endophyticus]